MKEKNNITNFQGISADSREIRKNFIFFAIPGEKKHGIHFAKMAEENGASLIITNQLVGTEEKKLLENIKIPVIQVAEIRKIYSQMLTAFYDSPALKHKIIAVTGTNGKSTTQWLVTNFLLALKQPCLRIGTLGVFAKDFVNEDSLTTPDAAYLQKILFEATNENIFHTAIEVSSHAIDQERVFNLSPDIAIFTNLTRDHLDYHGSMEDYFNSKKRLFSEILLQSPKKNKLAIICIDSKEGAELFADLKKLYRTKNNSQDTSVEVTSFGFSEKSENVVTNFTQNATSSTFIVKGKYFNDEITTPYIGEFNVQNFVGALIAVKHLGFSSEELIKIAKNIPQTLGRLQYCGQNNLNIYVDYAHTPDALEKALITLQPIAKNSKGKLAVVFGCGGDRDKGKRPEMAKIAQKYASFITVTSDNPRTENPSEIIKDILASGISANIIEEDRSKAISQTLASLESNDVLLIAGKGHEEYQIVGTEKKFFSDVVEVQNFFNKQI